MQVIVIGGGIGGLTMALSLHQAGIPVRIYEAVRNVAPLGVGINLQPNAVRELTELGLADGLKRTGIATERLAFFNKHGQLIFEEPRGMKAGYKWPQYSIHRGRLQMLLWQTTQERIGRDNMRDGYRLVSFEERGEKVVVTVENRQTGAIETDEADVLIGADGIHSTIRRQLYPNEGEPRFARQMLWRAATEIDPVQGGRSMLIAGHFHKRVVLYPMAESTTQPGRILYNWIAQITVEDTGTPPREDWNKRVPNDRVMAEFGSWRFPWLDMRAVIEATEEIFEFPLVDRDPVAKWTFGRVTLIGDAAHPMQPIGSQAGSQAIIDTRALTAALLKYRDPREAFARYDAERRPMMNDIILRNRALGPETALQIAEERAPEGFKRIEDVMTAEELHGIVASFNAAAGLDIETVNNRPSFVPAA